MWHSNDATGEYVYMNIYAMTLEIKSLMIYMSFKGLNLRVNLLKLSPLKDNLLN